MIFPKTKTFSKKIVNQRYPILKIEFCFHSYTWCYSIMLFIQEINENVCGCSFLKRYHIVFGWMEAIIFTLPYQIRDLSIIQQSKLMSGLIDIWIPLLRSIATSSFSSLVIILTETPFICKWCNLSMMAETWPTLIMGQDNMMVWKSYQVPESSFG